MKVDKVAKPILAAGLLAAGVLLCFTSVTRGGKSSFEGDGVSATNEAVNVDLDFTRMNRTMMATYTYRLAANPQEFVGKTLRVSGTFLTRVDTKDGKRYFGCLMGDPSGCLCCSPGSVLEFIPESSYVWPTDFPPVESRITVTGNLKMCEVGSPDQSFTIPRLVDAGISKSQERP